MSDVYKRQVDPQAWQRNEAGDYGLYDEFASIADRKSGV